MTPSSEPLSALEHYSLGYQDLFHDRRLFKGFQATLSWAKRHRHSLEWQHTRALNRPCCAPNRLHPAQ